MQPKNSFISKKITDWIRDITALGNPIVLLFVPFVVLGATKPFFYLLIALMVNEIIGSLIKVFFHKKRPVEQPYDSILEKIDAGSFPSIHTSRITLTYLTLLSQTEELAIQIALLFMIVFVMFSRVYLKKHFWKDVLGGWMIGACIWFLFLHFY